MRGNEVAECEEGGRLWSDTIIETMTPAKGIYTKQSSCSIVKYPSQHLHLYVSAPAIQNNSKWCVFTVGVDWKRNANNVLSIVIISLKKFLKNSGGVRPYDAALYDAAPRLWLSDTRPAWSVRIRLVSMYLKSWYITFSYCTMINALLRQIRPFSAPSPSLLPVCAPPSPYLERLSRAPLLQLSSQPVWQRQPRTHHNAKATAITQQQLSPQPERSRVDDSWSWLPGMLGWC